MYKFAHMVNFRTNLLKWNLHRHWGVHLSEFQISNENLLSKVIHAYLSVQCIWDGDWIQARSHKMWLWRKPFFLPKHVTVVSHFVLYIVSIVCFRLKDKASVIFLLSTRNLTWQRHIWSERLWYHLPWCNFFLISVYTLYFVLLQESTSTIPMHLYVENYFKEVFLMYCV